MAYWQPNNWCVLYSEVAPVDKQDYKWCAHLAISFTKQFMQALNESRGRDLNPELWLRPIAVT
jgi:hypothetical protein